MLQAEIFPEIPFGSRIAGKLLSTRNCNIFFISTEYTIELSPSEYFAILNSK